MGSLAGEPARESFREVIRDRGQIRLEPNLVEHIRALKSSEAPGMKLGIFSRFMHANTWNVIVHFERYIVVQHVSAA